MAFLRDARRRLTRHYLPLVAASLLLGWMIWLLLPARRDLVWKSSMVTAYLGLGGLAATLIVGPVRAFAGRRTPVSLDLRRDLGIWSGVLGLAHVGIGWNVHLRGRPWLYLVYPRGSHHWVPVRHDLFGFANETGLAAAILIVVLLATSNDWALRRYKAAGWKRIQRWSYPLLALTVLHGWLFQRIENRMWSWVAVFLALGMVAAGVQLAGVWRRHRAPSV